MGAWGHLNFENDTAMAKSQQAIDRIKNNSEQKDLREESGNLAEWNKVMDNLNIRISS